MIKLLETDNEKKYLSDRQDEAQQFFSTINFDELFNKIKEVTKDNTIRFDTPKLGKFNFDRYNIDWRTNDLSDKCGVMSSVFNEVFISNFGGGISSDRDTGELFYWVTVAFRYQQKNGGSNGIELFNARFVNGQWQF